MNSRPAWGRLALLWGGIALFFVGYRLLLHVVDGVPVRGSAAVTLGLHWLSWALATPVVVTLSRRFPFTPGLRIRHGAVHAAAAVSISAGLTALNVALYYHLRTAFGEALDFGNAPFSIYLLRNILVSISIDLFVYTAIAAIAHALDRGQRAARLEVEAAKLEGQLAQAQLQALRMQLNPHFLFNALQTVSALTHPSNYAARRTLRDLGDLLRLSLDASSADEVPLEEELAFLERYLAIERVRFQDRLTFDLDINDEALGALVPNLLLQPLVENAIKHGLAPHEGAVRVVVSAECRGDTLLLRVEDDAPPSGMSHRPAVPISGVGLKNTRARLEGLYGTAFRFDYGPRIGGGFAVSIALPYHLVPASDPLA